MVRIDVDDFFVKINTCSNSLTSLTSNFAKVTLGRIAKIPLSSQKCCLAHCANALSLIFPSTLKVTF
jgi:hypothetical protein